MISLLGCTNPCVSGDFLLLFQTCPRLLFLDSPGPGSLPLVIIRLKGAGFGSMILDFDSTMQASTMRLCRVTPHQPGLVSGTQMTFLYDLYI